MPVTLYPAEQIANDISHLPGIRRETFRVARSIANRARRNLAATRYEGHSYIDVSRGTVDAFVNLNDPGGHGNALAIEADHTHNFSGRFVAGQYVLRDALWDEAAG